MGYTYCLLYTFLVIRFLFTIATSISFWITAEKMKQMNTSKLLFLFLCFQQDLFFFKNQIIFCFCCRSIFIVRWNLRIFKSITQILSLDIILSFEYNFKYSNSYLSFLFSTTFCKSSTSWRLKVRTILTSFPTDIEIGSPCSSFSPKI